MLPFGNEDAPISPDRSQTLKQVLDLMQLLLYGQIAVAIMNLFLGFSLMSIFAAVLLYCAISSRHYLTSGFYVACGLMDVVNCIVMLQRIMPLWDQSPSLNIRILLYSLQMPFYTVSLYYGFLLYRELKALSVEGSSGGSVRYIPPPPSQPFQGQGYRMS